MNTNQSINRAEGGALNATSVSVHLVLQFAYDLRDYQILNAPDWANSERYDIVAKPEASEGAKEGSSRSESSQEHLRLRTQALMARRFGLVVHKESREMPIYALVVAKGGVKFSETKPENRSDFGPQMGRPVLDRTGLTGDYDLHMEFAPEAPASKPGEAAASEPTGPSFMMALQEQLGLKLETTKGPVEFLVIDRIERPSAN